MAALVALPAKRRSAQRLTLFFLFLFPFAGLRHRLPEFFSSVLPELSAAKLRAWL